jgi:hypothetical protein
MTNDTPVEVRICDFTIVPGARHVDDGDGSAEEFFDTILKPTVDENKEKKILIDFDGTYGFASSFISELAKDIKTELGVEFIEERLVIKSDEDSMLIDRFKNELAKEY